MKLWILDAPLPQEAMQDLLDVEGMDVRLGERMAVGKSFPPWEEADAVLTGSKAIDATMIGRLTACRVIVHLGPGRGPDAARIDLEAAREAGIYVSSVPDHASPEWAADAWERVETAAGLLGWDGLNGRRLGLIGLGEVGTRLARRANEQGMQCMAFDPFCPPNNYEVLGVRKLPLDELIGCSQIVSLQLPSGPATRHLMDEDRLRLFQKQTAVINVSAPDLMEPAALVRALRRGRPRLAIVPEPLGELNVLPEGTLLVRSLEADRAVPARRRAIRRAIAVAWTAWRGQRPMHLLIDPPYPRFEAAEL